MAVLYSERAGFSGDGCRGAPMDRRKCVFRGNENEVDITTGFRVNPKDPESYVRGQIIVLIGYIYTLQAK